MSPFRTPILCGLLLLAALPGARGEEKTPLAPPTPFRTEVPEAQRSATYWKDTSEDKTRRLRETARESRRKALELLRADDPYAALKEADRAVLFTPKFAENYATRAMIFEALHNRKAMLEDLRRATALDPQHYSSHYKRTAAGESLLDPGGDFGEMLIDDLTESAPEDASGLTFGPGFRMTAGAVLVVLALGLYALYFRMTRDASPAAVALEEGVRLSKKYTLASATGVDGSVPVWLAHDRTLGRTVVLRRLLAGKPTDEGRRLVERVKTAAALQHPNILDFYEILEIPEGVFAVSEHARGETLRGMLERKKRLQPKRAAEIFIPVQRALEYAHGLGVVHGGLSPERVLIERSGLVKVSDFALAKEIDDDHLRYAAPELRAGRPCPASDLFSAGMMLREILTGALTGSEQDALPPGFAQALDRMTEPDPARRAGSMDELQKFLAAAEKPRQ